METGEGTILALLIILFVGLLGPEVFRRLKLSYFSSLIILGAVLGPHGLSIVAEDPIISFFGFLGFAFLMFMAGLESNPSASPKSRKHVAILTIINSLVPMATGVLIVRLFGYDWGTAALTGIILASSSVAIIFPAIKSTKLFKKDEGKVMVAAVLFEDMFSLVMLAVFLQSVAPITGFPIPVYFAILLVSVIALKFALPKIAKKILANKSFTSRREEHEEELRFIIVILIAVLVFFQFLGVHPILAAFLVGLLLSDVLTSEETREKIHTLGFGIFVPVFFFVVGTQMDLTIFAEIDNRNVLIISLILAGIGSKFLSGYLAGRIVGFSSSHSTVFGVVSTTHLTTALAATFAASSLGLLDTTLVTAIIGLTIVTTVFAPLVAKIFTDSHKAT